MDLIKHQIVSLNQNEVRELLENKVNDQINVARVFKNLNYLIGETLEQIVEEYNHPSSYL